MTENIDYTKLINLIKEKRYECALSEVKTASENTSVFLALFSIYCEIELKKYRSATISVNKALKTHPNHYLLHSVKEYLKNTNTQKENPLNQFVTASIDYSENASTFSNEKKLDKLLEQLLIKPYIK